VGAKRRLAIEAENALMIGVPSGSPIFGDTASIEPFVAICRFSGDFAFIQSAFYQ
jgi:hypothetical protein